MAEPESEIELVVEPQPAAEPVPVAEPESEIELVVEPQPPAVAELAPVATSRYVLGAPWHHPESVRFLVAPPLAPLSPAPGGLTRG